MDFSEKYEDEITEAPEDVDEGKGERQAGGGLFFSLNPSGRRERSRTEKLREQRILKIHYEMVRGGKA